MDTVNLPAHAESLVSWSSPAHTLRQECLAQLGCPFAKNQSPSSSWRGLTLRPVYSYVVAPVGPSRAYLRGERYRLTTLGPGSMPSRFMSTRVAEWLEPITQTVSSDVTCPANHTRCWPSETLQLAQHVACRALPCTSESRAMRVDQCGINVPF